MPRSPATRLIEYVAARIGRGASAFHPVGAVQRMPPADSASRPAEVTTSEAVNRNVRMDGVYLSRRIRTHVRRSMGPGDVRNKRRKWRASAKRKELDAVSGILWSALGNPAIS